MSRDDLNSVFGKSDVCLHCQVWDFINANAPKNEQGAPLYTWNDIVPNLLEVIAELTASVPSRAERRQLLNRMDREFRRYVADKVASGEHPGFRKAH